jgi:hypothetical protein
MSEENLHPTDRRGYDGKLQMQRRNPRTCNHHEESGSIHYCNSRDVVCAYKSREDCCRIHPTAGWTRDFLCQPYGGH